MDILRGYGNAAGHDAQPERLPGGKSGILQPLPGDISTGGGDNTRQGFTVSPCVVMSLLWGENAPHNAIRMRLTLQRFIGQQRNLAGV